MWKFFLKKSNFEAVNLLQKADLNEKKWKVVKNIKMDKENYKFASKTWFKRKKWKIIN